MPFRSKAQARYLFSQHPDIAKRWAAEGYIVKGLPKKVSKKKRYGMSNLKRKNA